MRRLARHAFTALAALSLLLCVAVCVLWVRSYFAHDLLEYHVATPQHLLAREWTFVSNRGVIGVHRVRRSFETPEGMDYYLRHDPHKSVLRRLLHSTHPSFARPPGENPYLHWLGFSWKSGREVKRVPGERGSFALNYTLVDVPCWLPALLLSAPLLHRAKIRLRRGAAKQAGRCPACGYDLRASPDRCPECGAAAAADSPRGAVGR